MIKYHLLIDERSTISLFTNKLKDASTIRFFGLSKNYSEATNNLPNIYLSDIVVVSENLGIQFLDNFSHLFVTNSTTSSHACKVVKLVLTKDEVNEVNASLYKEINCSHILSQAYFFTLSKPFLIISARSFTSDNNSILAHNSSLSKLFMSNGVSPIISGIEEAL